MNAIDFEERYAIYFAKGKKGEFYADKPKPSSNTNSHMIAIKCTIQRVMNLYPIFLVRSKPRQW